LNALLNLRAGPSCLEVLTFSTSFSVMDPSPDEAEGEFGAEVSSGNVEPDRLAIWRMTILTTLIAVRTPRIAEVVYQYKYPSG
jgi:hypothetical protein